MEWHRTLVAWLVTQGFEAGKNDPCVFVNSTTKMRAVVVVDDILCRGSEGETEKFYEAMRERFDVKDPSYLTVDTPLTYVGIDVSMFESQGVKYIQADQDVDVTNYLDEIGVKASKAVDNPMPNKYSIYNNPTRLNDEDSTWYRSVVGALNYYACTTRYDISYPVSRLSQFSARPTVGAKVALLRVLAYVKCTTDFALIGRWGGRIKIRSLCLVTVIMRGTDSLSPVVRPALSSR